MVTEVTSTTEKRGVVFIFLSELLYNPKILSKFALEMTINKKSDLYDPHTETTYRYPTKE